MESDASPRIIRPLGPWYVNTRRTCVSGGSAVRGADVPTDPEANPGAAKFTRRRGMRLVSTSA